MANALEAMILYFRDEVVRRNIGHGADAYTPFIITLFFFILVMNLLGLVPWGSSPPGISGDRRSGDRQSDRHRDQRFGPWGRGVRRRPSFLLPREWGPVGTAIMLVIMTPVELVGKLAKPFALMIRLFANMTAGHTVILSLVGLIFVFGNLTIGRWGIAAAPSGMSVAMMLLELFVAFLQAYIFAMLTSVFIGLIRHAH